MREMMAALPWPEYQQRVRAGAVVFLPVGATEQHGYHLALGVDTVLPLAVSRLVARNIDGIVAPRSLMATSRNRAPAAATIMSAPPACRLRR